MNADEMQSIMDDAEAAAVYFKTLVREGVPPHHATQMTMAWITGHVRGGYDSQPPRRESWEDGEPG